MSLRDELAAWLATLLLTTAADGEVYYHTIADHAYSLADAMLRAREVQR